MRQDGTGCDYAFYSHGSIKGSYPCCKDKGHKDEHKHFDELEPFPAYYPSDHKPRVWPQRTNWMTPQERAALPEVKEYMAFIEKLREDMRSPNEEVRQEAWKRTFKSKITTR
jgi:hypothetical protein